MTGSSYAGRTTHQEHLAAHADIDVMLDSFPQGGGITALESLLMGVPVVTLLGEQIVGRIAASFLTSLGMDDLVAETPDEYVSIAASWPAICPDWSASDRPFAIG